MPRLHIAVAKLFTDMNDTIKLLYGTERTAAAAAATEALEAEGAPVEGAMDE